ncbi:MAG: HAD-IC family P-type ATPase, partial [Kiritimatiellia bacterium]
QEYKAERAIEALAKMVKSETTVRRTGRKQRLPSSELVPGDVVLLQSGDSVPADLRLFKVRSLQVEEAALTGESVPVQKDDKPLPPDTVLGDRLNLCFAGTLVTYGQAEGVVTGTGDSTEMGRIAVMISGATEMSTPLTQKIAEFSRLLLYVILGLAALAFAVGVLRGESPSAMFMAAVALAVGAIPEGLPAAVTITLAIGVARMARRHAIIRKMPAVETLGSTTVICSDKTGTLTENKMTVSRVWAGGQMFAVTGNGYEPSGQFLLEKSAVEPGSIPALKECLLAGLLCNDSQLVMKEDRLQVEGDPTEAALIVAARKAGLDSEDLHRRLPRVDVIPFESEHMYMATLHGEGQGRLIYKKGSIESLLDRCDHLSDRSGNDKPIDQTAIFAAVEKMTSEGLRVLAFARRRMPDGHAALAREDVSGGLTLLGLQGMIDPARPEAIAAVAKCQSAGITVKMITGDHRDTAVAIGRKLGLRSGHDGAPVQAMTGKELEHVSEENLPETAERTAVFARVAPEQKLRLVRALQKRGHIVAMTGDGVNDAPALKQADIGVAMGITGTDVAKGAADMILTDDNFASIEAAVEEGRNVFANLTKFIAWTMPTNGGEGLLLLAAIFLGTALPVLPVQLLWINMTTALLLGMMLVFEPKEKDLMARPPRAANMPILTPRLLWRILAVSVMMLIGGFALFAWEQNRGAGLPEARTAVVNVIVMVEAFYLLNCRSLSRPLFALGLFSNMWVIFGIAAMMAAQLLFTYAPFMNTLFHSAPISAPAWIRIIGIGLAVFIFVEIKKNFAAARRAKTAG